MKSCVKVQPDPAVGFIRVVVADHGIVCFSIPLTYHANPSAYSFLKEEVLVVGVPVRHRSFSGVCPKIDQGLYSSEQGQDHSE